MMTNGTMTIKHQKRIGLIFPDLDGAAAIWVGCPVFFFMTRVSNSNQTIELRANESR